MVAPSLAQAQTGRRQGVESVTVTGYAARLEKATDAKRDATNFTDTVFAEDIGKFPDTNIAESLNRIPGVTISREIDGEGVSVSIRGLGSDFTKVTLNGASIDVASTGSDRPGRYLPHPRLEHVPHRAVHPAVGQQVAHRRPDRRRRRGQRQYAQRAPLRHRKASVSPTICRAAITAKPLRWAIAAR